jgi:N-acetylglucosaminyldiphosphoundecaprenol N-acetyl-beta-D-mannosaminyltransferase
MNKIVFKNGLWINNFESYSEAVHFVADKIRDNKSYILNFLYFSCFVIQEKNLEYRKAIQNSDYLFLDGIGMNLYARIVRKMKHSLNLNGTDLLPEVLSHLDALNTKTEFALYGAKSNVISKTHNIFKNKFKNLNFYSYLNGYEPFDVNKLRNKSTFLIGLGTPKQELFVQENLDFFRNNEITTISVGGLFDFVSGNAKRAPKWVRNFKLEWAYRFVKNPKSHLKKNIRNLSILKFIVRDLLLK